MAIDLKKISVVIYDDNNAPWLGMEEYVNIENDNSINQAIAAMESKMIQHCNEIGMMGLSGGLVIGVFIEGERAGLFRLALAVEEVKDSDEFEYPFG